MNLPSIFHNNSPQLDLRIAYMDYMGYLAHKKQRASLTFRLESNKEEEGDLREYDDFFSLAVLEALVDRRQQHLVSGLGFRGWSWEFWVSGLGIGEWGFWFRVSGCRFQVSGFGFWVSGLR